MSTLKQIKKLIVYTPGGIAFDASFTGGIEDFWPRKLKGKLKG